MSKSTGTNDPMLWLTYRLVPRRLIDIFLPQNASFPRQAASLFSACFLVGASMELFMIKTGFYWYATKKEAERQLERKVEYEEQERIREERRRQREQRAVEKHRQELRMKMDELHQGLMDLRLRESQEKVKLNSEKKAVKEQIRDVATELRK